ncbi:hypothetical protein Vretimale_3718 [Volvox reticuliferus]|uniref:Major facilitator superfamily (MFS) profile domain-containing protein n=3 Tax=Volvox reticuliferus TaxID=1737510 RepID=A0A8J4BYE6_9CHLO|nr:hypothetical protein Vretifemale_1326 [Volvox reticuliferus]GIL98329.1 hypothetical protein Vretimale_3718 [Volvox reticuliferus]
MHLSLRKMPNGTKRSLAMAILPESRASSRGLLDAPQLGVCSSWLIVVALCGMVAVICSIDRTAMSVAVLPMGVKYGWSDTVKGAVSSAFNLGHTLTNFYGGVLAATYSPKLVLSIGVIVWSAFTLLTPPAAVMGLVPLFVVRACMGLGEGVAYPTMQAIIKGWVPLERRSRSLSLMYSGHQVGSIVSLLWSPIIIASAGVDVMFYVYGAMGFIWLAIWEPCISQDPPLLHDHRPQPPAPPRLSDLPWGKIFSNRVFWALMVCHSTFGVIYNTAISWMPRYYNSEFGLDVRSSSFLSVLPWLAMAAGTNISGWLADFLINRKLLSTSHTRKLLQVVGSAGPAICLLYLAWGTPNGQEGKGVPQQAQLTNAVVLLVLTMALLGFQAGGFASTHQDIATRLASVLFGTTNASASLAGSAFVYAVGVILDRTQSWARVFELIASCCLTSAAIFVVFATSEPQFD